MRKSPVDRTYARGAARTGTTARDGKTGVSSKNNSGVKASATGKKSPASLGRVNLCLGLGALLVELSENGDVKDGKSKTGQYEGPNANLAAMLERHVLETSHGVRWEDVAGLNEAKRLLEEVVVLPLWMPEYF